MSPCSAPSKSRAPALRSPRLPRLRAPWRPASTARRPRSRPRRQAQASRWTLGSGGGTTMRACARPARERLLECHRKRERDRRVHLRRLGRVRSVGPRLGRRVGAGRGRRRSGRVGRDGFRRRRQLAGRQRDRLRHGCSHRGDQLGYGGVKGPHRDRRLDNFHAVNATGSATGGATGSRAVYADGQQGAGVEARSSAYCP